MPRMNGLRLFEELQRLRPGVKVLFISGYTGEIAEESLLQSSGQALLKKPFTPDILTRRVREILDAPAVEPAANEP